MPIDFTPLNPANRAIDVPQGTGQVSGKIDFQPIKAAPAQIDFQPINANPAAEPVQFDQGQPVQQYGDEPTGETAPTERQNVSSVADQTLLAPAKTGVNWAMDKLQVPSEVAKTAVLKGLDKTIAPGIEKALRPEAKGHMIGPLPEPGYFDVTDFLADKYIGAPEDVKQKMKQFDTQNLPVSSFVSGAYRATRAGIGLAASVIGDPLMWLSAGAETPAMLAAKKEGDFAKMAELERVGQARYRVQLKSPNLGPLAAGENNPLASISDQHLGGLTPGDYNAARMTTSKLLARVPVVGSVGNATMDFAHSAAGALVDKTGQAWSALTGAFNPYPENPQYAVQMMQNNALRRGAGATMLRDVIEPAMAQNYSRDEMLLMGRVIEATPNVAPNAEIPANVLKGLGYGEKHTPEAVGKALRDAIPGISKELGLDLTPARQDQIIQDALLNKRLSSENLEKLWAAGKFTDAPIGQYVRDNYLVHKLTPQFSRYRSASEIAQAQEIALERQSEKALSGSNLDLRNPLGYRRTLEGTLQEVNERVKAHYELKDDPYLLHPVIAQAMKNVEAENMLRDRQLLDQVKDWPEARTMTKQEAAKAGYEKLNHPIFDDVKYVDKDGNMQIFGNLALPKDLASKVNYFINKRSTGNVQAFFDSYNRVFRTTALASPGYWIRNSADNMGKNYVLGVKMEDYGLALQAMSDKASSITMGGKTYSSKEVGDLLRKWGITEGNQYREGLNNLLYSGKQLMNPIAQDAQGMMRVLPNAQNRLADAIQRNRLISGMNAIGERGENLTRAALFLNRIADGYSPAMAAVEVEKYLFDFTRNSQVTDYVRTFGSTFIQHAVKTLQIAPEMIMRNPGYYNALHNYAPQALSNALGDPVHQDALKQLIQKPWFDPVAGVLIPGNGLAKSIMELGMPQKQGNTNLGYALGFRQTLGMDILNQFSITAGQNPAVNPLLKALGGAALGIDFNKPKQPKLDPTTNDYNALRRISYLANSALSNEIATPNIMQIIKQATGIADPKTFQPYAMLMFNGGFSQFGKMVDLDREYFFKQIAFREARRDLMADMIKRSIETKDIAISGGPTWLQTLKSQALKAEGYDPANTYAELQNLVKQSTMASTSAGVVQDKIPISKAISIIRSIDDQADKVNKNYATLKAMQIEAWRKSTAIQRQKLMEQMDSPK